MIILSSWVRAKLHNTSCSSIINGTVPISDKTNNELVVRLVHVVEFGSNFTASYWACRCNAACFGRDVMMLLAENLRRGCVMCSILWLALIAASVYAPAMSLIIASWYTVQQTCDALLRLWSSSCPHVFRWGRADSKPSWRMCLCWRTEYQLMVVRNALCNGILIAFHFVMSVGIFWLIIYKWCRRLISCNREFLTGPLTIDLEPGFSTVAPLARGFWQVVGYRLLQTSIWVRFYIACTYTFAYRLPQLNMRFSNQKFLQAGQHTNHSITCSQYHSIHRSHYYLFILPFHISRSWWSKLY